ncbi:MAG: Uma2 family endonuclease, partial [Cyanobacteria bacterium P01_F01_bin.150]
MSESISDATVSSSNMTDSQDSVLESSHTTANMSANTLAKEQECASATQAQSSSVSPAPFDPKSLDGDAFEKHLQDPIAHPYVLPDHTQLPDNDGTFVKNFHEHPQSILLTDSITPVLKRIHPDEHYAIGQDSGIYWRITEPLVKGAEAPDWFYVPNVPPLLDGIPRRSYVLWKEHIAPTIAIEFASGDGSEERNQTPLVETEEGEYTKPGKFWVYEQVVRIPYYAIFIIDAWTLEVYALVGGRYQRLSPNAHGRYAIPPMDVELGIWDGHYAAQNHPWLRWWDLNGVMLPIGHEQAEQEKQRAEQEKQRAEHEKQRAEQEKQRAEQEKQRA